MLSKDQNSYGLFEAKCLFSVLRILLCVASGSLPRVDGRMLHIVCFQEEGDSRSPGWRGGPSSWMSYLMIQCKLQDVLE